MVLFPTLLATKHTQKNHQLLQFRNPLLDLFHNPHASTRQQSFDMVTLVPCDGGDARVDLLRVQRHAQQHEESPQGIHELDQENKVGFWVDRKESFVSFGQRCLGLELDIFCHGSLGLEQRVWSGVDQREK